MAIDPKSIVDSVPSKQLYTFSELINSFKQYNDDLRNQINLIHEKLYILGRPLTPVEIKHEEQKTTIDMLQYEVDVYATLINKLNNANAALGSII